MVSINHDHEDANRKVSWLTGSEIELIKPLNRSTRQ